MIPTESRIWLCLKTPIHKNDRALDPLPTLCLSFSIIVLPQEASADVVITWNAALREAAQADETATSNPGWASRSMAMMNGAIYDSMQAINRTHRPFLVDLRANTETSFEAAASEVAHHILSSAYQQQSALFDETWLAVDASIAEGPAKAAGTELGRHVAKAYMNWRTNDGADHLVQHIPSVDVGRWRPDPLNPSQEAWGPAWGSVRPFALLNSTQFPVSPPPDLSSQAYAFSLREVQELGAIDSRTRTEDQTETALFWAYDRRLMGPPPVLFNGAVSQIAEQQGNSVEENARLFAMTSVAMADAGIASWESKYKYDLWRPISAIREADRDGNPLTEADPTWVPLGAPGGGVVPDFTPPFPAYVSGHATFAEATFKSLAYFYGNNQVAFDLASDELPGVIRHFESFTAASEENARSRVYMGVHFDFDSIEGRILGQKVADWIHAEHFYAVPEPESIVITVMLTVAIFGSGMRFRPIQS